MSSALRRPGMTREQFFAWEGHQTGRYEFDGCQPVAMTGGLVGHAQIIGNLHFALRSRLRGGDCRPLGPDAGVATMGDAIRYPDAVISCRPTPPEARTVTDPVIVFEVLSPGSGRTDRIVKAREYRAVPSIRRYVIIERDATGATVLHRPVGDADWTATMLTADESIPLPECGIDLPLALLREGIEAA